MKKSMLVVVASALMSLIQIDQIHAADLFLSIPGVKGEVTTPPYGDWIRVDSAAWGHATKLPFEPVTLTKGVDIASPELALAAAEGKHFPGATLHFRRAGIGGQPFVFLQIILTDVTVKAYAAAGDAGGALPSESVKLGFVRIEWRYTKQNPDGTLSAPVKAGWDQLSGRRM